MAPENSAQIRAARALLGWSMIDLAKAARVSVSTVKRIEDGSPQPLSERMIETVRQAMEQEGVTFLPDDGEGFGLRLRPRPEPQKSLRTMANVAFPT